MERAILHCDLNNYFASVECLWHRGLEGKPVAVCGSARERKGIVLAKNMTAKAKGVSTGEPIWSAKQKCPGLLIVPPHYDRYMRYSGLVREIYSRYTDRIEPFGIDECWLDVTGCEKLFGTGEKIAHTIRKTVKAELGLTVSIGVSFNKTFAKLGSDMKKPDAVTVIPKDSFQEIVWPLPVKELLFAGPATCAKLKGVGIYTIGDLAKANPEWIHRRLGINGDYLQKAARGLECSYVAPDGYEAAIKSIGNSTTCIRDLRNDDEVWRVLLELSRTVCRRMKNHGFCALGIQLMVRDAELETEEFRRTIDSPICSYQHLAREGFALFRERWDWNRRVRALGIRAVSLAPRMYFQQLSLLEEDEQKNKWERLENTIGKLEQRYGDGIVRPLSLSIPLQIPDQTNKPGFFH